jgi:3,4-dihydroxy-2-butanone 4-phosphate synthase
MEDKLKSALDLKFLCPSKFSQIIEELVKTNEEMNYIDAIVHYCEENGLEVDSVAKLISKPLKEKLKCDAINLNFLKRTSRAKLLI